mgnify:CR=1 FL=1
MIHSLPHTLNTHIEHRPWENLFDSCYKTMFVISESKVSLVYKWNVGLTCSQRMYLTVLSVSFPCNICVLTIRCVCFMYKKKRVFCSVLNTKLKSLCVQLTTALKSHMLNQPSMIQTDNRFNCPYMVKLIRSSYTKVDLFWKVTLFPFTI